MGKKAFIAGSPLLSELIMQGLQSEGYDVFLGVPAEKETPYYRWNPRSPISTQALLTEGIRTLKTFDDAVLVFSPPGLKEPFEDLSARSIESAIDDYLKGSFFLMKETMKAVSRYTDSYIHCVLTPAPVGDEHPLDASIRKALTAFLDALFTLESEEPYLLQGFQGQDLAVEEYAQHIVAGITNRQKNYHSRWRRFGSGQGLLSVLPFGSRKR
ncbi:MAG: hypothetical protein JW760_02920 [Spirochaetales bacterium]|nr:hypothetical protein [Spirochaetales bacterium]